MTGGPAGMTGGPAGMTEGPAGMTEAHPTPSPLAGEGWGEGLSGHDKGARACHPSCPTPSTPSSVIPDVGNRPSAIPDVGNPPAVIPDVGNRPSVVPDVGNPLSVIPDIFNRESKSSPMPAHTNKGTKKQNTGFPLTTGGNDRGGPTGMTEGHPPPSPLPGEGRGEGVSGHDKRGQGRQGQKACILLTKVYNAHPYVLREDFSLSASRDTPTHADENHANTGGNVNDLVSVSDSDK